MAKIVFNTDIIVRDGTIGYTDPQPAIPPPQALKQEQPKPPQGAKDENPE